MVELAIYNYYKSKFTILIKKYIFTKLFVSPAVIDLNV